MYDEQQGTRPTWNLKYSNLKSNNLIQTFLYKSNKLMKYFWIERCTANWFIGFEEEIIWDQESVQDERDEFIGINIPINEAIYKIK